MWKKQVEATTVQNACNICEMYYNMSMFEKSNPAASDPNETVREAIKPDQILDADYNVIWSADEPKQPLIEFDEVGISINQRLGKTLGNIAIGAGTVGTFIGYEAHQPIVTFTSLGIACAVIGTRVGDWFARRDSQRR